MCTPHILGVCTPKALKILREFPILFRNKPIFPVVVYHFQIFEENKCCSRKTVLHYIYPAALRNPTSLA